VQPGSQEAWMERLAGMGISATPVQLPAAHFWSSARVGIATGDIAGVERMLQSLPDGPDSEWQRGVLKALDVGTGFNVQGDSAFTISPTTLDESESDALQRLQFSLVDGSKYTAPPTEQSAFVVYAGAVATGLRECQTNRARDARWCLAEATLRLLGMSETAPATPRPGRMMRTAT
jgi:hypothetical protein